MPRIKKKGSREQVREWMQSRAFRRMDTQHPHPYDDVPLVQYADTKEEVRSEHRNASRGMVTEDVQMYKATDPWRLSFQDLDPMPIFRAKLLCKGFEIAEKTFFDYGGDQRIRRPRNPCQLDTVRGGSV